MGRDMQNKTSNIYTEWINKNYPTKELSVNKCHFAVKSMSEAFPELIIQVGLANGVMHCWLKDTSNNIIDPTSKQFSEPINYFFIADRFLEKDEYEASTGAIFLRGDHE